MESEYGKIYTVKSILELQGAYITQNHVTDIKEYVYTMRHASDIMMNIRVSNLHNVESIVLTSNGIEIHDFLKNPERKYLVMMCCSFTQLQIKAKSSVDSIGYTLSWKVPFFLPEKILSRVSYTMIMLFIVAVYVYHQTVNIDYKGKKNC